jgi:hypothetical protein
LFDSGAVTEANHPAEPAPPEQFGSYADSLRSAFSTVQANSFVARVVLFFLRHYLVRMAGQLDTLLKQLEEGKLTPEQSNAAPVSAEPAPPGASEADGIGRAPAAPRCGSVPSWAQACLAAALSELTVLNADPTQVEPLHPAPASAAFEAAPRQADPAIEPPGLSEQAAADAPRPKPARAARRQRGGALGRRDDPRQIQADRRCPPPPRGGRRAPLHRAGLSRRIEKIAIPLYHLRASTTFRYRYDLAVALHGAVYFEALRPADTASAHGIARGSASPASPMHVDPRRAVCLYSR